MRLHPYFQTRDFAGPLPIPGALRSYRPSRFSWNALGGPDEATIEVKINARNARKMADWLYRLRVPVTLYDERGTCWWWGYVHEVSVPCGKVKVGVTIDGMGNRIYVGYNNGTTSTTTAALDDTDSIAKYGRIELLEMMSDIATATAEQRRAILLANRKEMQYLPDEDADSPVMTLTCRGWYRTLGWRYYGKTDLIQTNLVESGIVWPADLQYISGGAAALGPPYSCNLWAAAQQITIAGSENYEVDKIAVNMFGEGSSNDMTLSLRTALGGADLCSGVVTPSGVQEFYAADVRVGGGSRYTVTAGATYWLVDFAGGWGIAESVAVHIDHRYTGAWLQGDPGGWKVSTDYGRAAGSLTYKLYGVQAHETQIASICAASEFVTSVDVRDASGVSDSVARDGNSRALQIIEDLLAQGTTNNRRLLATVTASRVLKVYEEPAPTRATAPWIKDRLGRMLDSKRRPLTVPPVGNWYVLADVPISDKLVPDLCLRFAERAEYDCAQQQWRVESKNTLAPWDTGGIAA